VPLGGFHLAKTNVPRGRNSAAPSFEITVPAVKAFGIIQRVSEHRTKHPQNTFRGRGGKTLTAIGVVKFGEHKNRKNSSARIGPSIAETRWEDYVK